MHSEPPSNSAPFRVPSFCHAMASANKSNSYEDVASVFITGRGRNSSAVGASVVAGWSQTLPGGGTVLELGCGPGVASVRDLIDRGVKVAGDAALPTFG